MNDLPNSELNYELWVLLSQARDALFKARGKELMPYGITAVQAAVLFIINAIGNRATAAEISKWMLRENHSVSGLLSRMEKEGLICRSKDFPTRSLARITLTEKGQQVYYQSLKNRESIHNAMRVLSQEEQQQLHSLLKKVRDEGIRQLLGDPKPPFPQ